MDEVRRDASDRLRTRRHRGASQYHPAHQYEATRGGFLLVRDRIHPRERKKRTVAGGLQSAFRGIPAWSRHRGCSQYRRLRDVGDGEQEQLSAVFLWRERDLQLLSRKPDDLVYRNVLSR